MTVELKSYPTTTDSELRVSVDSEVRKDIIEGEILSGSKSEAPEILMSELSPTLAESLRGAKILCVNEDREERGGVIFTDEHKLYQFVYFENMHHGTTIARCLFQPDIDSFGSITYEHLKTGYQFYASFHTHPMFSENPSGTDFLNLFAGFRVNILHLCL